MKMKISIVYEKKGRVGELMQCVIIVFFATNSSDNMKIVIVSDFTEDTDILGMYNSNSTKLFLTNYTESLSCINKTFSLKAKKKMFGGSRFSIYLASMPK